MKNLTILVTTWGDGLFALTDDGCTQEIANQPVRGLAPDGPAAGALAIVGGHSLSRREASGQWATVATSEFELSCCMAVSATIYVGTDDARMLRLEHGARALHPVAGFDNIAGRDTWFAGSAIVNGQRVGPPLGVRSVGANSDGTILFANVHVGGIPRSMDGGAAWHPTIDIQCDVHEVRAHPANGDIVAAASAVGLCLSRDAGLTWTIESEGLHARHCSAVAFSGDDVLVSASSGPFGADGRIYRRPLRADGPSLRAIQGGGIPEWTEGVVDTACIAANGASVAFVDRAGNCYGSEDFGQTWSCRSTGLASPSGVLVRTGGTGANE